MTDLNQLLIKRTEEEEYNIEILKLYQSLQDLDIINKQLTDHLHSSEKKIEEIRDHIDNTSTIVDKATDDLKIASDYSFKFFPIVLGVSIGFIIGGPFGLIPGFKAGGLITGGGLGIFGGVVGYKIQK